MNNKVLSFSDAVQRRAEKSKSSAAPAKPKTGNVILFAHEKPADAGEDTEGGAQVIPPDIRNTPGHIVNEFDNL
jgi:hypothetical protein